MEPKVAFLTRSWVPPLLVDWGHTLKALLWNRTQALSGLNSLADRLPAPWGRAWLEGEGQSRPSKSGLLALDLDILLLTFYTRELFAVWGCPVHCRMCSLIPGFSTLLVKYDSRNSSPRVGSDSRSTRREVCAF